MNRGLPLLLVLIFRLPLSAQFGLPGDTTEYVYLFERNVSERCGWEWCNSTEQGEARLSVVLEARTSDTLKYTVASQTSTWCPGNPDSACIVEADTVQFFYVNGFTYRAEDSTVPWSPEFFPNLVPPENNGFYTVLNVDTLPCMNTSDSSRFLRVESIWDGFPWAMYFVENVGLVYHQSSYGSSTVSIDFRAILLKIDGRSFSVGSCIGLLYRPITISYVSETRATNKVNSKHMGVSSVREYDLQGRSIPNSRAYGKMSCRVRVRQTGADASFLSVMTGTD